MMAVYVRLLWSTLEIKKEGNPPPFLFIDISLLLRFSKIPAIIKCVRVGGIRVAEPKTRSISNCAILIISNSSTTTQYVSIIYISRKLNVTSTY